MKTIEFDNAEDWKEARRGKITGTKLKDLIVKRGTKPKVGFYELIAERIAVPPSDENAMDRGVRYESIALEKFAKQTKKKVNTNLVLWHRDEEENIAISPDGFIGTTEAVEVKCLKSALHIEALLTMKVPNEYEAQMLQYFIVNDSLKTLYFVFYDPRMPKDLFWLTIKRKDVQEKVEEYLALEKEALQKISEIEKELTF